LNRVCIEYGIWIELGGGVSHAETVKPVQAWTTEMMMIASCIWYSFYWLKLFVFVVQKKLVPMQQTLQEMGSSMMTLVNQIQVLMNLCACTGRSLQPSEPSVVKAALKILPNSIAQKQVATVASSLASTR